MITRRPLAALLLAFAACAADPVLLPDAGPCASACGAGTVCQGGACIPVDAGPADTGSSVVDSGTDSGSAPMDVQVAVDVGMDSGAADAGPPDVGVDAPVTTELPPSDLSMEDVGAPDAGPADVPRDLGYDPRCDAALPDFCATGRASGGGTRTNFCTFLGSDNNNCGRCSGDICSTAARHCELGSCRLNCPAGTSDCTSAEGCETNVNTSNVHCGRCGNACPVGTTCRGGGCL